MGIVVFQAIGRLVVFGLAGSHMWYVHSLKRRLVIVYPTTDFPGIGAYEVKEYVLAVGGSRFPSALHSCSMNPIMLTVEIVPLLCLYTILSLFQKTCIYLTQIFFALFSFQSFKFKQTGNQFAHVTCLSYPISWHTSLYQEAADVRCWTSR